MSNIESLTQLWDSFFPTHPVLSTQFTLWVTLNGEEVTRYGITSAAKKFLVLDGNMTTEHLTRYASACMRNAKWRKETKVQQ